MRNTYYSSHVTFIEFPKTASTEEFLASPVSDWELSDICWSCFDQLYPELATVSWQDLPQDKFFPLSFRTPDSALWAMQPEDYDEGDLYCENCNTLIHKEID